MNNSGGPWITAISKDEGDEMDDESFAHWQSLLEYTKCMRTIITVWEKFFRESMSVDWLSQEQIQDWLVRLRVMFDLLEGFHLFDSLSFLTIQTEEGSGFPKRRHLDSLALELDILKKDGFENNVRMLKSSFLETLFTTTEINVPLLERISKAQAREFLISSEVFLPFFFSGLEELQSKCGTRRAFLCSWERYVVQELPVKYVMLFEASEKWAGSDEDIQRLSRVLREETSLIFPMNELARHIDLSHAMIHPKWIGRIILGPVSISHITKNLHQLQEALDKNASGKELLSASRIIYEYVISEGESDMKTITDTQGCPHKVLQKFAVRAHCEEHEYRGVTHMEKHLFAPHRVIQMLDENYRKEINHTLNSY